MAQGFGFRLTVRRPDGREVGARQAITASAELQARQARATAAGNAAAAATATPGAPQAEEAGGGGEGNAAAGAEAAGGVNGGAAGAAAARGASAAAAAAADLDPLDALEPLDVDLDLDFDANGMLMHVVQQPTRPAAGAASLAGTNLARRLAKSPVSVPSDALVWLLTWAQSGSRKRGSSNPLPCAHASVALTFALHVVPGCISPGAEWSTRDGCSGRGASPAGRRPGGSVIRSADVSSTGQHRAGCE